MKKLTKGILLGTGVACGVAIISGIVLAVKKSLTGFTDDELDLDMDFPDDEDDSFDSYFPDDEDDSFDNYFLDDEDFEDF